MNNLISRGKVNKLKKGMGKVKYDKKRRGKGKYGFLVDFHPFLHLASIIINNLIFLMFRNIYLKNKTYKFRRLLFYLGECTSIELSI